MWRLAAASRPSFGWSSASCSPRHSTWWVLGADCAQGIFTFSTTAAVLSARTPTREPQCGCRGAQVSKLFRGGSGSVQQNMQAMMMQKMMEQMMSGKGGPMGAMGGMDPSSNPFAAMGNAGGSSAPAGFPFGNMPPPTPQPQRSSPVASRCVPGPAQRGPHVVSMGRSIRQRAACLTVASLSCHICPR
jgi:hypothetical protein